MRKWGFDIDGVLADFDSAFAKLIVELTGKPLVPVGFSPATGWSEALRKFGYTKEEIKAAWAYLEQTPAWWLGLRATPNMEAFNRWYADLSPDDEIYFVTARKSSKLETVEWLINHTTSLIPTVIRSKEKGLIARAIGLDVFVDDRLDLALDVRIESSSTRVYLLDRPSNAFDEIDGITRVKDLATMFEIERRIRQEQLDRATIGKETLRANS